ncbi:hypothetical protein GCM10028808_08460 [Spirosoma migulaei]
MKTNLPIVVLGMMIAFVACQSNTVLPDTTPGKPTDSISVFKRVKISWTNTDYKEVEYDAGNKPIRYTRQSLYNEGTGEVLKVVYNLIYSSTQLTRVEASNGSYVTYSYDGNKVSRTQEFTKMGKLLTTRQYTYSSENRLIRLDETRGEGASTVETARTFTYDAKGNLSQVVNLAKDAQTGVYQIDYITRFSDYDSHKNVTSLWTIYPLLPNVTFQLNNPATITQYSQGQDGAEIQLHRSQYVYQYNAEDYPVSHTETYPGGTQTATYTYVGIQ